MKADLIKVRGIAAICAASVALLALTGCKEEQELYSYQGEPAKTELAGSPSVSTAPAAPAATPAALSKAVLPPPDERAKLPEDAATALRTVAGVRLTIPETWPELPEAERSRMRAAQWTVPNPDGAPGELVAFHFGAGQGGDAQANIQRWLGQIEIEPGGAPDMYKGQVGGLTLTEVYVPGTLKPSTMGVGPSEPVPGSALYGLVIEGGPAGSVFLKLTGPRALVESCFPALGTLVAQIDVADQ